MRTLRTARSTGWCRRAALGLLLAAAGCAPGVPPGPLPPVRLEAAPGTFVDVLPAGAELSVTARGVRLRGLPVATAGELALVRGRERLPLRPGADGGIDLALAPGQWRLEGSGHLEEARLVTKGPGRLVLLVLVDTLRDDHLTPALMPQTLAALGGARRFLDTRANASWTLPSLASLMSSRSPLALTAPDGTLIGLAADVPALAAVFREAGFATAAFSANGTLREANGFGRGFARFAGTGAVEAPPTDAAELLAAAERWLAAHRDEDRFVWIHLMEPHEPLRDHEGRGRVAVAARIVAGRDRAPTPEEAETFRALYAGEVRYLDRHLGPFLAALEPGATVALTADHGEMLGEETAWGHGTTVFDPVIRVPLLLAGPGIPAGDDPAPAALLDLAPTLLARAGLSLPGAEGFDLLTAPPPPTRVRLAATFSVGPLRWVWQRGDRTVIAHFSPQPGLAPESQVALHERHPLPAGWRVFDHRGTAVGLGAEALTGELLADVAAAFAADAGRLAPGIQLLATGLAPGEALAVEVTGEPEIVQLLATSTTRVERRDATLALSWPQGEPRVLAALAGRVRPAGPGGATGRDAPPAVQVPGRALWRNRRDAAAQHPQDEVLAHLRALGYLR